MLLLSKAVLFERLKSSMYEICIVRKSTIESWRENPIIKMAAPCEFLQNFMTSISKRDQCNWLTRIINTFYQQWKQDMMPDQFQTSLLPWPQYELWKRSNLPLKIHWFHNNVIMECFPRGETNSLTLPGYSEMWEWDFHQILLYPCDPFIWQEWLEANFVNPSSAHLFTQTNLFLKTDRNNLEK